MSNTTKQQLSISEIYSISKNSQRLAAWAKDRRAIERQAVMEQTALQQNYSFTPILVLSASGELLDGFASVIVAKERGDSTILVAVKEV